MRVTGQSADGRTGTSGTLSARRLVRQVVLEVRPHPRHPQRDRRDRHGFRGTTFTPSAGPRRPTASAEPYAFPAGVLGAGERSGPLALRFFHEVQPNPPRTRVVNLAIPFPAGPDDPEPRRLRRRGHRPPPPPGHSDGVVTTGGPEAGSGATRWN